MSEYTLTEALADAREWVRDADTSQRGWRPALAVILREFRVQAEELAALRDSLIEANTELGVLISVVASARERAERAEARQVEVEAELAFARSSGDESAIEYRALRERLAEEERDAARYRWIHDNIDWIDGTGYVLKLHPDADGCAMFQWGVDAAMADSAASQPSPARGKLLGHCSNCRDAVYEGDDHVCSIADNSAAAQPESRPEY